MLGYESELYGVGLKDTEDVGLKVHGVTSVAEDHGGCGTGWCEPPFTNAAHGAIPESDSSCDAEFCDVDGCRNCLEEPHPVEHLVDVDTRESNTWWQSGTLYDGVTAVNVTLNLGRFCWNITQSSYGYR
ncbi:LAMC3 [Cordylochernes scorpioides]|uniref:LAMC3 n=1 Tax=Cordylochernes scorpioides TaxID=51811 RepID=A0ABY6K2X6_9ARAC|nr:LAMC3 [Cordylochernes scorpioides]